MDVYKIIGIGFIGTVLTILLREHKAEIAVLVSVATTAIIITLIIPYFGGIASMLRSLGGRLNIDLAHFDIVMRVIGIAYLTQFAAELSRDAGAGSIASNIELAGKVILIVLSMPIIYSLINMVINIVR